jgi:hypothetical protein
MKKLFVAIAISVPTLGWASYQPISGSNRFCFDDIGRDLHSRRRGLE